MSFADVGGNGSGGARQGTSAGGGGPDKFQQQSRALAGLVFQMSTQVAGFRRLVDALGSAKDTKELRTKIAQERENISRQARDANAKLKTLGREMDSVSPVATVKAVHSRLISDLQGVLKEFQRAQRLCAEKEMQFVPRDSPKPAKAAKPQRAGLLDDEDNGAETESLLQGEIWNCLRPCDREVALSTAVCVAMMPDARARVPSLFRVRAYSKPDNRPPKAGAATAAGPDRQRAGIQAGDHRGARRGHRGHSALHRRGE